MKTVSLMLWGLLFAALSQPSYALNLDLFCGRKVANANDPLLLAVRNPRAFRDRLSNAASASGFDLTAVPLPEASEHCSWMSQVLRESSWGDRALRFVTRGAYHRISHPQQKFLSHLEEHLVSLAKSPTQLSYADFLHASGMFTLAREIELYPHEVVIPAQYDIRRFPFDWKGFSLNGIWSAPAPSLIDSYGAKTPVESRELADYALVPLQQEMIDDYLLDSEQTFLRMIAYRLYPVGLARYPISVHGGDIHPQEFAEHDLLHARINLRAWRDMLRKAGDESLAPALRKWYQATQHGVEAVADDLAEAMKQVEDPELRRAIRAVAWDVFHENEVPFNALDAYSLVFYHFEGRDVGSRFELGSYYAYQKTYGPKVKLSEALQWHLAYWSGLLPAHEGSRIELLRNQEEYLLAHHKIRRPGEIRWPMERFRR